MTGGYSASGGDASSGVGSTAFENTGGFGGLHYNAGINPTHLIIGAVIVAGLFLYATIKAK
mgnify:FL=1